MTEINYPKRIGTSVETKKRFDAFLADVQLREGKKLSHDDAILLLIDRFYHPNKCNICGQLFGGFICPCQDKQKAEAPQ